MAHNALALYQDLIDGLVERKNGVMGKWIMGGGFPKTEANRPYNELLSQLSPSQKAILADLVQAAREGGMHDTLAYLNEMMDGADLAMTRNSMTLPYDAFAGMNYDFACRCAGDDWPE